jgi:hypothetical protein
MQRQRLVSTSWVQNTRDRSSRTTQVIGIGWTLQAFLKIKLETRRLLIKLELTS